MSEIIGHLFGCNFNRHAISPQVNCWILLKRFGSGKTKLFHVQKYPCSYSLSGVSDIKTEREYHSILHSDSNANTKRARLSLLRSCERACTYEVWEGTVRDRGRGIKKANDKSQGGWWHLFYIINALITTYFKAIFQKTFSLLIERINVMSVTCILTSKEVHQSAFKQNMEWFWTFE